MRLARKRDGAEAAVVGVVLMVAVAVALAAYVAIQDPAGLRRNLERESNEAPPDTGFYAEHGEDYLVEPLGPDDVPLVGSTLQVVADGQAYSFPASALAPQLPPGATAWQVGELVCIAGSSPGCLRPAAQEVSLAVASAGQVIVDLPALPSSFGDP